MKFLAPFVLCLFALSALAVEAGSRAVDVTLLIDDFTAKNGKSQFGTNWEFFADTVMGGRSSGNAQPMTWGGRRCLRLRGDVSLETRGGFIQTRLPLADSRRTFDAGDFRGVQFWAKGNGERYEIHLRTANTWLPWQYYAAGFEAKDKWTLVKLPFSDFKGFSIGRDMNSKRLSTVGMVAIKKAFKADAAISDLEFYR